MSDHRGHKDTFYDIMLFRDIPYHLDMALNEFMELSDLNHDKLKHSSSDFYISQKCVPSKEECIYTSIDSKPNFNNTTIGAGHMTVTEIGEFNPEVTGEIHEFSITKQTLD